jgi:hypothetical protein
MFLKHGVYIKKSDLISYVTENTWVFRFEERIATAVVRSMVNPRWFWEYQIQKKTFLD